MRGTKIAPKAREPLAPPVHAGQKNQIDLGAAHRIFTIIRRLQERGLQFTLTIGIPEATTPLEEELLEQSF